jgi:NADPH:quinone reductase-like Zn-dependent oxidoreductase
MLALAATETGDFRQTLSLQTVTVPPTDPPDLLLVHVAWSDLNPVDLQKLHTRTKDFPFVSGFAGSGIVYETSDESAFPVGASVCFLLDPTNSGSYAQCCRVDRRAAALVPPQIPLKEAASVPLAGCTAYESLKKLGFMTDSVTSVQTLLIVGGSGGVGSWATRMARALHPNLDIICTSDTSRDWCLTNGASRCIPHHDLQQLSGGPQGSVDAILCLTEPTPSLMNAMSEVIRPYGRICLVVAGSSIRSLNLDFVFFKSVTVYTETVFSCFRTQFSHSQPSEMIAQILNWMSTGRISAPLSPSLDHVDLDWTKATVPNGILEKLHSGHVQGKLVMRIGDSSVAEN